jgi:hypothetical protein
MLKRMRFHNAVADREVGKGDGADQGIIGEALRAAHEAAKDAAPYMHPRLSAIEHMGEGASPGFDPIGRLLAAIDGKTRSIPEANQRKMIIDVTPTAGPNAILDQVAAPAKTNGSENGRGWRTRFGWQLAMFNASTPSEIEAVFAAIAPRGPDALLVASDPFFLKLANGARGAPSDTCDLPVSRFRGGPAA